MVATIPVGNKPIALAVTSDGSRVLVANNLTSNISVINTANNSVSATWTTLSGPAAIAIFGNNVYVANQFANSALRPQPDHRSILTSLTGMAAPNALALTPDGSHIYVTNGNTAWCGRSRVPP